MDYNFSIPDIYNIKKNHSEINKNILSKTIILESDKIYDLDDIFFDIYCIDFTGLYFKTNNTNIYLSTNNFKDVHIYNNFFILDLFNRCSNNFNFIAKDYDAELTIYIINKPTTKIYTFNYVNYDSKNLQQIQNSNNRFYNYDGLFKNDFYNMNIITLQINVICKNDNLKKILKFQINNMIFYYKSNIIKKIKKINNLQYLYIFHLYKLENTEKNESIYIENILNINNIDNVITYINKLNEINGIICKFLFESKEFNKKEEKNYDAYNIDFTNYIIKNNIDNLYFFNINFS